jgi:uridine kinase
MKKIINIGIVGASGSGKTFLSRMLESYFGKKSTIFTQDNYYIPREEQPIDKNGNYNFDTPKSLYLDKFIEDLNSLKKGNSILQKQYNYNNPNDKELTENIIKVSPNEIIITEGIFIFHLEIGLPLFDYKIFITSEEETRLKRRIKRDIEERGYDEQDVLYKFENHLKQANQLYVEPHREKVDFIFDNSLNSDFYSQFQNLTSELERIIK